jgi:ABC-2 type transport system permease protein
MSIMRELTYRTNFIIRVFTDAAWLLGTLLFLEVFANNFHSILYWDTGALYILFGTHYLINTLLTAFLFVNGLLLGNYVNSGSFDSLLLLPVPTVFSISFRIVDLSGLIHILSGFAMLMWGCHLHRCHISIVSIIIYIAQVLCGVLVLYGIFFSLMYLGFWTKKTEGLENIYYATYSFREFPSEIFPYGIRLVLTFLIPMTIVANPAAKTLVLGPSVIGILSSIIGATACVGVSLTHLMFGLRKYRGAGA